MALFEVVTSTLPFPEFCISLAMHIPRVPAYSLAVCPRLSHAVTPVVLPIAVQRALRDVAPGEPAQREGDGRSTAGEYARQTSELLPVCVLLLTAWENKA